MGRILGLLQKKFGLTAVELIKSVFVSLTSFLFDYLILCLLTSGVGLYHLASNIISYAMGWVLNYILSSHLVFKEHRFRKQFAEVLITVAIVALGFALNELFLWLFTDLFGIFYQVSKIIAGALTFFFNFFLRKFVLYDKRRWF